MKFNRLVERLTIHVQLVVVPTMDMEDELYRKDVEVHDDGSKELDAGLRPLDHYKQVSNSPPLKSLYGK